jgi:hypothetical protein
MLNISRPEGVEVSIAWSRTFTRFAIAIRVNISFFSGIGPPWVSGLLAFAASALSAISTFLDPAGIASRHHRAGVAYARSRQLLRQFAHIDTELDSNGLSLSRRLRELTEEVNTIQADSPAIPAFAREQAKADIEGGSAAYTDAELSTAMGDAAKSKRRS